MSAAVAWRQDFTADDLWQLASAGRNAGQGGRLLALAENYDGGSRTDATRIEAVDLQTVRDWVLTFNAEGPANLIDGMAPGNHPKPNETQRQALARIVESGPDPDRHGVVRGQLKDLDGWIHTSFSVSSGREHSGTNDQAPWLSQALDPRAPSRVESGCPGGV